MGKVYYLMELSILEEVGLTKSEIKVYLALLKLGSSTKKAIVKEAKITSSKLYEITDKLIEKGMVSYVKKNRVLHFDASPPEQVLDFIKLKEEDLEKQANKFKDLIPQLKLLKKEEETEVEVFTGWKGVRTAYKIMLNSLSKDDTDYVLGATKGENQEKVIAFFNKIHQERRNKKIKLKIIFNKEDRKIVLKYLGNTKLDEIKFIAQTYPSETNIWKDNIMIVLLTKNPLVVLIKNKFIASSYKNYFNLLWKIAKK